MAQEIIKLKRDCEATMIPTGNKLTLPEGMEVKISQALGGSFTIVTDDGYMVRIGGQDADALGKEPPPAIPPQPALAQTASGTPNKGLQDQVWDLLRTCYDPEIPVNIVDLGLIYVCSVTPLPEGGNKAEIKMTLTAPGCGMGDVLRQDVYGKVSRLPGIKTADVQLVWDPVWDQSRMSEAARLQLGIL